MTQTSERLMPDDPITFCVERNNGQEAASIIYGPLPERLKAKLDGGQTKLIFACRLDKLPNGEMLRQMPIADLYEQFVRMRAQNKLPPSNLADPPKQAAGGQKGMERGPETWWKPTPLPRGRDWTPDYPLPSPTAKGNRTRKPVPVLR
jgi:hypothetical protein